MSTTFSADKTLVSCRLSSITRFKARVATSAICLFLSRNGSRSRRRNRVGFYNAYYHTYAPDSVVETWTGREDTSALEALWTRAGEAAAPEGELHAGKLSLDRPAMPDGEPQPSKRILFEHEGPAVITSLRFTPLFPLTDYELNHILLRIYWDDSQDEAEVEASVSAPLGSFFGSGLGEASVRSALLGTRASWILRNFRWRWTWSVCVQRRPRCASM